MKCPFYRNFAIEKEGPVSCVYLQLDCCEDIDICPEDGDAWCTEMINKGLCSDDSEEANLEKIFGWKMDSDTKRIIREGDLTEEELKADKNQPAPKSGEACVLDQVLYDLVVRAEMGKKKYGTLLKTFNGRNALVDAYQEALDLVMYLKQELMERSQRKMK